MEYVKKKWDLHTMEKKLESLKKVIPAGVVDFEINNFSSVAEDRLDALYLAYYALKDMYCKVRRSTFGKPKIVKYEPKKSQDNTYWYSLNGNDWSTSSNSWTISYTSATTNDYLYFR
jgi:hypothetical protein